MAKLTRQQLELINRRTLNYPLPIAEKDYYLAIAVALITSSPLNDSLIFKGGTALHHCYLKQYRFSEDLDFTSQNKSISLNEIVRVLESDGTFRVNKKFESDFTLKIERLQYQGLLGQPGNIKVEVDRHQNVVLPGIHKEYINVWQVSTQPLVMDPVEICSEKIRASAQRARYRDFYDLHFLINELRINLEESIKLLRKKEIRYPVTPENISSNWNIAQDQMERDIGSIYISKDIPATEIDTLVRSMRFGDIEPNSC